MANALSGGLSGSPWQGVKFGYFRADLYGSALRFLSQLCKAGEIQTATLPISGKVFAGRSKI
jgi:hypothetical protein